MLNHKSVLITGGTGSFGQAFVRGSAEGSGLSLAVTRAVALAHGGDLRVESSANGTTVRLSLPLDASPMS